MPKVMTGTMLFLCLALPEAFGAEALKKIRIASKAPGESLVPYTISQRLGFYREEGLDVDVVVTRGTVTTQVVVSAAVDYGNGGSIPAILGGAKMKILQVSTDKPSQYLVVSPKITNIAIRRCCFASFSAKTAWRSIPFRCAHWVNRQCDSARSWPERWTRP